MINQLDLKVADLNASSRFYEKVLAPLGYVVKMRSPTVISFSDGRSSDPMGDLYLSQGIPNPFHFAFQAETKEMVQAFYEVGLQSGGTDNGAPGYRDYHPFYYAAFLIDPDGYRIEAVTHTL